MAMKTNFLRNILGVDNIGDGGCYFGDVTAPADADVVIISAPWSVTSDFGRGATYTPDAIIDTSLGSELYDVASGFSIQGRVATANIDYHIQESSEQLGRDAERIIRSKGGRESLVVDYVNRKISNVNEGFEEMHASIYKQVKHWASKGKRIAVVGGDHSVAFGAVKAMSEVCGEFGVLFIDAHADYSSNGIFKYSHRSIARDVVEQIPGVEKLVQVGVRDVDKSEVDATAANDKVEVFYAENVAQRRFEGVCWGDLCREFVAKLPQNVYISLDVDALKIEFCNNTNAPTPGGMTFDEVVYLVNCVVESGRNIVGFDISEVVTSLDNKMDAIVGARLLAKLSVVMLRNKE